MHPGRNAIALHSCEQPSGGPMRTSSASVEATACCCTRAGLTLRRAAPRRATRRMETCWGRPTGRSPRPMTGCCSAAAACILLAGQMSRKMGRCVCSGAQRGCMLRVQHHYLCSPCNSEQAGVQQSGSSGLLSTQCDGVAGAQRQPAPTRLASRRRPPALAVCGQAPRPCRALLPKPNLPLPANDGTIRVLQCDARRCRQSRRRRRVLSTQERSKEEAVRESKSGVSGLERLEAEREQTRVRRVQRAVMPRVRRGGGTNRSAPSQVVRLGRRPAVCGGGRAAQSCAGTGWLLLLLLERAAGAREVRLAARRCASCPCVAACSSQALAGCWWAL